METWIQLFQSADVVRIKKYIRSGADINAENEQHESVLALALKMHCDAEVIDMLIENGARLDAIDEEGVSIFDYAITYNHPKLFQRMIESGINVNHTSRHSRFTPLMAAVCYTRYDMVALLLQYGADTDMQDIQGFKAEDFARKMRKTKMLEMLSTS